MKKLLGLFGIMPLAISACGTTGRDEVELLPVAEGFITEFGDLNVYDLDSYHNINNGDVITLQLKLEQKTVAAQWGYEVRFSDINETRSVDMAEEIFGSTINRLFFSFPDTVMDQMTVGGVYLMEFEKNNFPPNGRPQFGISGIEATGGNMDMDGKLCSVDKLEDCHDLTNNEYGNYSSITNLREGGSHKIVQELHNDGSYYGIGDSNNNRAYAENYNMDLSQYEVGKKYLFDIEDTDWFGETHGSGDYYNSITFNSITEYVEEGDSGEPEEPSYDFGFDNTTFNEFVKYETYDNVVFKFNSLSGGQFGVDINGNTFKDEVGTDWPFASIPEGTVIDQWYHITDAKVQSQISYSSWNEIDYNPA